MIGLASVDRSVPFWPIEWIERLQRRRMREIVRHAYATVPFYRDAMDRAGLSPADFQVIEDLQQLPLIDEADVRENVSQFVSSTVNDGRHDTFHTSGSTSGVRKQIVWDHPAILRKVARLERDRAVIMKLAQESLLGATVRGFIAGPYGRLVGRALGIETRGHERLSIFTADFASRTLRAIWNEQSFIPRRAEQYHHLTPTAPFEVAADMINQVRPRVVFSFGSYADQFLRFMASSGCSVALPRLWVYIGDMVSPEARSLAERFGCMLYSSYGTTEVGTIGFQCELRTGFHINIDLCALRLIDSAGRTVPPGAPGTVVVSGLDNRATVLLNYRLDDMAVQDKEPCTCGRSLPVLSRLEGRRSEFVRLPDGREIATLTLEELFWEELRQTVQAQVHQLTRGEVVWRIVPFAGADRDSLRNKIVDRARQVLGHDIRVNIDFVDDIPRTGEGKFKRTVREAGAQS